MFEYIEKLRDKPRHKRQFFVLASSIGITAIIFIVWSIIVVPNGIQVLTANNQKGDIKESPKQGSFVSTLATVKQGFTGVWGVISDQFTGFKENFVPEVEIINSDKSEKDLSDNNLKPNKDYSVIIGD